MDPGTVAVIGLCAFLALWYGGGYLYNRRRGRHLLRWLEEGLDVLGDQRETGWIGSPASGARINVIRARPPFRRLEITLLLENRELPFLWLLERLRYKRDRLIIRATLRSTLQGEVEVVPANWRAARHRQPPWVWQEGPHRLTVGCRGPGVQRQVAALQPWLEAHGMHLRYLSWSKRDPHIQLQINVARLLAIHSGEFLASLQAAMETAR